MRDMQLKHLRTFLAVASTLSFTRAGQKVHLAQSSVTEQIQALEADLGVALFERSQRKLALTDAGAALVEYAGAMLALAADARAAVLGSVEVRAGSQSARWKPCVRNGWRRSWQNSRAGIRHCRLICRWPEPGRCAMRCGMVRWT